jgi:two-component system sensor histidine kinase YesM
MRKRKSMSIRTQIILYFLITTGVILIAAGSLMYFNFSSILEKEILNSTRTGIDSSGRQLELYIQRVKDISDLLAGNSNTCSYFEHGHNDHVPGPDDLSDIESMINTAISGSSGIETIIMVGHDGKVISSDPSIDMELSGDMMQTQWYMDALDNSMPVLTSARMQEFSMDKDEWVLSLSREIVGDCKENIGVLLIDFNYTEIEMILEELKLGSKGYSFILNGDYEVVYHPDTRFFEDEERRLSLVELSEMSNNSMEQDKLIHKYNIEGTNWTLVGIASLDSIKVIRQDMVVLLWVLGSALLIISLGSGVIFSRKVASPLAELEEAMAEVESGKLDQDIEIRGSLETESIAGHYISMIRHIRELMDEITQKEKYLRTSELNVLQNQINPHFLYNTLDTIIWSAEFKDSEKVISITKALAKFFRLSLRGGSELTTVEDELEHVRQYLFIQKQRYEDKLEYTIDFDESIGDIQIPKLILQPIVENALYHGIRDMETGGKIEIKVQKDNDDIVFIVLDNGKGYDTAKSISESSGSGVGQSNVDKRVKLYYGNEYGISVVSNPGSGTRVTVRLGMQLNK